MSTSTYVEPSDRDAGIEYVRTLTNKMINSRRLVEEGNYDPEVELDISSCFGGVTAAKYPTSG